MIENFPKPVLASGASDCLPVAPFLAQLKSEAAAGLVSEVPGEKLRLPVHCTLRKTQCAASAACCTSPYAFPLLRPGQKKELKDKSVRLWSNTLSGPLNGPAAANGYVLQGIRP